MVGGCCVCSDERGWDENPLVYCDGEGCAVAVHQACYGIVTVPPGPWFCRKCELIKDRPAKVRCDLCPNKDGAFKKTDSGGWAHVVCALYIPEVRFENVTTMEPILTSLIPLERYNKSCYICEQNKKPPAKASFGAFMECNKAGCRANFHVTCAQYLGLLCEEAGNLMDNVKYCGYCQYHSSKLKKTNHLKIIPPFKPAGVTNTSSESPSSSPEKAPSTTAGPPDQNSQSTTQSTTTTTTATTTANSNNNMNISPDIISVKKKSSSNNNNPPPNSTATGGGITRNLFASSTSSTTSEDKAEILSLLKNTPTNTTKSNNSSPHNSNSKTTGQLPPPPPDIKPHVTLTPIPMDKIEHGGSLDRGGEVDTHTSSGSGKFNNKKKEPPPPTKRASRRRLNPGGYAEEIENSETDSAPEEFEFRETIRMSDYFNNKHRNQAQALNYTNNHNQHRRFPLSSNPNYQYQQFFGSSSVSSREQAGEKNTSPIAGMTGPSVPGPPVRKRGRRGSSSGPGTGITTRQSNGGNVTNDPPPPVLLPAVPIPVPQLPAPRHNLDDVPPTPTLSQLAAANSNVSAHPPHMFGNTLNPSSTMAQQMVDSLSQEIKTITGANGSEISIGTSVESSSISATMKNLAVSGNGDISGNSQLVGIPFPGSGKNSNPVSSKPQQAPTASAIASTSNQPQTLEDLLERQWDQGSQFLMEQAAHLDIAQLLSCLNQLKQDNRALEDHVATLCQRKEQLAAINARLNIPLTNNTQVYVPGLRGQGQHQHNSNTSAASTMPLQNAQNAYHARMGLATSSLATGTNGPQAHPQSQSQQQQHYANTNRGRGNSSTNNVPSHHQ